MPALPNVPNVIRVDIHYSVGGDLLADSRHFYSYTGPAPSVANMNTMAGDIGGELDTDFIPLMGTTVSLEEIVCTDLSSASGARGSATNTTAGTRAGEPVPPGAAAVVNYQIGRRYRGGKPRNYFPFGTASDIATAGVWGSAFLTAVEAGWGNLDAFILGLTVGTTSISDHVNVSYFQGFTAVENTLTGRWRNVPKLRPEPVVDVITNHTVQGKIGSQRRRNRAA